MKIDAKLVVAGFFIGVGLVFSAQVSAQTEKTQTKLVPKKETYESMLKRLKGGDLNVDFGALRVALTETKGYSGEGGGGSKREMFAALNAKDYKQALTLAEKRLDDDFVDMNGQFVASIANRELKNDKKAEYHHQIFNGLMQSIIGDRDGKSEETAYQVISTDEEYVVISYLDIGRVTQQALLTDQGHTFDKMTVTDPKTKKTVDLFFNLDLYYGKGF